MKKPHTPQLPRVIRVDKFLALASGQSIWFGPMGHSCVTSTCVIMNESVFLRDRVAGVFLTVRTYASCLCYIMLAKSTVIKKPTFGFQRSKFWNVHQPLSHCHTDAWGVGGWERWWVAPTIVQASTLEKGCAAHHVPHTTTQTEIMLQKLCYRIQITF